MLTVVSRAGENEKVPTTGCLTSNFSDFLKIMSM